MYLEKRSAIHVVTREKEIISNQIIFELDEIFSSTRVYEVTLYIIVKSSQINVERRRKLSRIRSGRF